MERESMEREAMVGEARTGRVPAGDLELPVPLDRIAYRRAKEFLEGRGIIEDGRLTRYGRAVEKMPVEREWAELLVNADDALIPYLAVMSGRSPAAVLCELMNRDGTMMRAELSGS